MVVRIAGKRMYLWRAVDHEGEILDMLVQGGEILRPALRLMRKLLKKQGFAPKLLVTYGHRSSRANPGRPSPWPWQQRLSAPIDLAETPRVCPYPTRRSK
jgi:hypothetical protein